MMYSRITAAMGCSKGGPAECAVLLTTRAQRAIIRTCDLMPVYRLIMLSQNSWGARAAGCELHIHLVALGSPVCDSYLRAESKRKHTDHLKTSVEVNWL